MKSSQQYSFSQVPKAQIPRSSFNRDHTVKTTFDAGYLVPIYVDEVLPGDTFNVSMAHFTRMATPIRPIMDNVRLETFFFAVPIRLIWENFQRFMGEQDNPGDSTDYVLPYMYPPTGGWQEGSIADYFGIPTGVEGSMWHSALWHRAYNLIYNEWFRDENLQDAVVVNMDDGPDYPTDYQYYGLENFGCLRRGKRHDYFTSALPWPQKGEEVSLPLGTSADVKYDTITGSSIDNGWVVAQGTSTGQANLSYGTTKGASTAAIPDGSYNNMYADLSDATAATINQLRQAFQIQRLLERDARGGTRYTELIRSHFGVISPDARLQRPEYLGGGSNLINVNAVAQTSSTDETTPQGNLSGIGVGSGVGHGFVKSFTEHCIIIGLACARADLTYQQGLNRMFRRQTRYDLYWPTLSHLGEQTIESREIYADGTGGDDTVFGYQERYAEYRYKPSLITGQFRSQYAQSLDSWHLAQEFSTRPTLNADFIVENPPFDRVIAVENHPHFMSDMFFKVRTARPMPMYATPGMIDHF
jgi:hypothetical protein